MTDSFVEEETTLEKGQLRRLFERATPPTDSEIASAQSTLNSARATAKATKLQRAERELDQTNSDKKRKDASCEKKDSLTLLALLDSQIQILETSLADRYGDDFAENLAAEYLDEETYKELMAIEDQDERRAAIAAAINEGIANGTIDPSEIYADAELKEWLEKHATRSDLENQKTLETGLAYDSVDHDSSLEGSLSAILKV